MKTPQRISGTSGVVGVGLPTRWAVTVLFPRPTGTAAAAGGQTCAHACHLCVPAWHLCARRVLCARVRVIVCLS